MTTDNKRKWSCDWNDEVICGALDMQGEEFDIILFDRCMDEIKPNSTSGSFEERALRFAQIRADELAQETPGSVAKTEYGKTLSGNDGYTVKLHVPKQVSALCFNEVIVADERMECYLAQLREADKLPEAEREVKFQEILEEMKKLLPDD